MIVGGGNPFGTVDSATISRFLVHVGPPRTWRDWSFRLVNWISCPPTISMKLNNQVRHLDVLVGDQLVHRVGDRAAHVVLPVAVARVSDADARLGGPEGTWSLSRRGRARPACNRHGSTCLPVTPLTV